VAPALESSDQIVADIFHHTMSSTYLVHLIVLDFVTPLISSEEYK